MVMLDRLLSGEQAELALGASVVERDVQCAAGIGPPKTESTTRRQTALTVACTV